MNGVEQSVFGGGAALGGDATFGGGGASATADGVGIGAGATGVAIGGVLGTAGAVDAALADGGGVSWAGATVGVEAAAPSPLDRSANPIATTAMRTATTATSVDHDTERVPARSVDASRETGFAVESPCSGG